MTVWSFQKSMPITGDIPMSSLQFSNAATAAQQMRETRLLQIPNGTHAKPTFSAAEMQRRIDAVRAHMAGNDIDGILFTSYHNIN
jgi:creatinase